MSVKDKAREKLLNSMRKTKSVISEQPNTKQAHAETYSPPSPKPMNKPMACAVEEAPLPPIASTRPVAGNDPYQSRNRIWPD